MEIPLSLYGFQYISYSVFSQSVTKELKQSGNMSIRVDQMPVAAVGSCFDCGEHIILYVFVPDDWNYVSKHS